MRISWAMVLTLSGCGLFQDIEDVFNDAKETVEDLTNPTVGQAVILGVEEPNSEQIDLSNIDVEVGTGFTMFLANAAEVSDLENAPVEGAAVNVSGNNQVAAVDSGDGIYTVEPGQGLEYVVGSSLTMSVDVPGVEETGTISIELPDAVEMSVEELWEKDAAMSLDFRGQGFGSALIIVYDAQNGELTWDNRPETISEVYEVTKGTEQVGIVEVPGAAFPKESLYVLGVTGMVNADSGDIDGMNTLLSGLMAGKMKLFPVATLPDFDTDSWDTDLVFDTDLKWDTDLLP